MPTLPILSFFIIDYDDFKQSWKVHGEEEKEEETTTT
jgi:hypothetical protein